MQQLKSLVFSSLVCASTFLSGCSTDSRETVRQSPGKTQKPCTEKVTQVDIPLFGEGSIIMDTTQGDLNRIVAFDTETRLLSKTLHGKDVSIAIDQGTENPELTRQRIDSTYPYAQLLAFQTLKNDVTGEEEILVDAAINLMGKTLPKNCLRIDFKVNADLRDMDVFSRPQNSGMIIIQSECPDKQQQETPEKRVYFTSRNTVPRHDKL